MRHTLLVGSTSLRKVGNVLLQRNSNRRVGHAADGARAGHIGVVESVGDIKAVKRRRSREQVSVGLVVVRFVEVEGVAGEAQLGDESRGAVDVVCVALSLGAVEDGRVESGGQVVESLWECADGGDGAGDLLLDVAAVLDEW